MVPCTTGCTRPSATSGQTCSTTEAQIADFSAVGRERRVVADHRPALAQQRVDVELGLGAALHADDDQPPLGGERGHVAVEVLGAHVVEDDVGAVPVGATP